MRRRKYNVCGTAVIGLMSLVLTVWTATLYAGDEDMSPSAYHVFDPETGYMITVDPEAEEQSMATGDSVTTGIDDTDVAAPVPWQFWVAAFVIAGGIFVWRFKRPDARD
ncbi:MAG: hypothetical protein ACE5KS_02535 [Woeseiaceae bacterium]